MNFLLHRHLAAEDLAGRDRIDPQIAAIGAMLPDLWGMANRAIRPRGGAPRPAGADRATRSLLEGVDHHLRADAWFHRHPVFVEGEAVLAAELRSAAPDASKMGLFGHIGWELCLDGALVRVEGLEPTLDALRRGVDSAAPAFDAAVLVHHPPFRDEAEAISAFRQRLDGLVASLLGGGWIAGYQHGEGLVARLSGVRRRVGLEPIGDADAGKLASILDAALDRAIDRLPELLADDRGAD